MGLFSGGGITGVLGALNPVAAIGTAVAGGIGDYFSADQQNRTAMQNAQDTREYNDMEANKSMTFSAAQAQKQDEFQKMMSDTSHQREVLDLKAAGLNPLLSVNSGASTPSGAMGSGAQGSASAAPVVPEWGKLASSATDAMRLAMDWNTSSAQADAARAAADSARAETGLKKARTPEAQTGSKIWSFINSMLDRFGQSAAGKSAGRFGKAVADDAGNAVDSAGNIYTNTIEH